MWGVEMAFIQWCNENNGFLAALLSIIGLLLSMIAIIVSLRTARLPFKKKLLLGSSLLIQIENAKSYIVGLSASATNIGNRTVSLTYLGYAIRKDGRFQKIYPINREFVSKATLTQSEMFEVKFLSEELVTIFSKENQETMLYVFASDTEEAEYKRKAGTVGDLLKSLN